MSKSISRLSVSAAPTTSRTPASVDNEASTKRNRASTGSATTFDFLLEFKTHFLIDDSQLMFGDNWQRAKEALLGAASYCTKHDTDGFSVSFLHHESSDPFSAVQGYTNIKSEAAVLNIFNTVRTAPGNSKPTGQRLKTVLDEHGTELDPPPHEQDQQSHIKPKPLKVVIITNGIPTDDITSVLASIQPQQPDSNPSHTSIEFWQVGRNAPASHFFYKTGMLRAMPSLSPGTEDQKKWKYDPDDPKKAGPSRNFAKFMFVNMLESRFMRTSR